MLLPAGSSWYDGTSNRQEFILTGHTVEKPKKVIIARRPTNEAGVSRYSIKFIQGVGAADPVTGKYRIRSTELSISNVPGQVLAEVQAATDFFVSLAATSNFNSDVGVKLLLPSASSIAV